ncbi:uncharacterized protein RAG0_03892 [Rhynchosporium agropyri]|uniref:Uncharacterized protein n=1 Tax=Rhynchosporium agropyri TaxID=914238 RepID=A0A1E1K6X9_9HELO|nr:uncharacterized protein RAG0_03892 [Rhynchosporium agropyri]
MPCDRKQKRHYQAGDPVRAALRGDQVDRGGDDPEDSENLKGSRPHHMWLNTNDTYHESESSSPFDLNRILLPHAAE